MARITYTTTPHFSTASRTKVVWQVDLFFMWIKQFFGTSENAVKSQVRIAVSVYVLVAIVKKRLNLEASRYTLLQIFSVTLFEELPVQQAFPDCDPKADRVTTTTN